MEDESGVGLANPKLSQGRRRMLDLVNRLHSTGVQTDIDLPQIAVIGSQSAGKSSLIESISGITLPRAAGTCTRCPTECRLSRSEGPWQCIVSIRTTTDRNGQPLGQARTERFGPVIYHKNEVEERIRRAQKAILRPSKRAELFLKGEDEGDSDPELSFSNNCVSLQISGPDVADLSFVDLPGLIASVSSSSKGSTDDIALVSSLVTSYIKKPNCIILLTVACETDFENQGAHRITKEYDPEGKRTIGVLTKPDRIPTGEESNWLPFIRNEKETLENNWFCVKQPSSNELKDNMTWDKARQRENEFFSSTAPWNELDAVYQKYLRTSNLVDRLSQVLSDLISKRLPGIYEDLEKSIVAARKSLSALPRPPSNNPQSEISSLLHDFVADLKKNIEGVPDEDGLIQSIRPAQDRFRRAIRATAPNFRPFESIYEDKRHIKQATFLVEEEGGVEDEEASETEEDLEEQNPGDLEEGGAVQDQAYDASDEEQEPDNISTETEKGSTTEKTPSCVGRKRKHHPTNKIYIDEVLQRAHLARTRELPGHFPFIVQQYFIKSITEQWRRPALDLCEVVHSTILQHVKKLVRKHFLQFGQGHLEQRVKTIMLQHIEKCRQQAEERISWLLELEDRPFSLNTHYLTSYRDKFLAYYRGERQRYDGSTLASTLAKAGQGFLSRPEDNPSQAAGVAKVLAALAEIGIVNLQAQDLKKLLPPDDMEPALVIMADVRAYFQVAFKRFTDVVPLAIDTELVQGVEKDVLRTLHAQLGINGPQGHEISQDLAQESPQVAGKRADLQKKLERLESAQRELLGINS